MDRHGGDGIFCHGIGVFGIVLSELLHQDEAQRSRTPTEILTGK